MGRWGRTLLLWLWGLVPVILGAASVGPHEAASNLSQWLEWSRIPTLLGDPTLPAWLIDKTADRAGQILAGIMFAGFLTVEIGLPLARKFTRRTGGPTWHSVREAIEKFGNPTLLADRTEKEQIATEWQRKLDELHEQLNNFPRRPAGLRGSSITYPDEAADLLDQRTNIIQELDDAQLAARVAQKTLVNYLQRRLRRGALIARGFVAPHTAGNQPVLIPAAEWQLIAFDLEEHIPKAKGGGIEYIGIEIAEPISGA